MPRFSTLLSTFVLAVTLLASAIAVADQRPAGIAWHDGSVDSAFARARKENRPVFMYWGAVWCPPCNRLKATLFKRPDFIARMRDFVPVYVDGDAPDAQAVSSRFKVRGYPTTLVFLPNGRELTRLPGEAGPERYLDVLAAANKATRPMADAMRRALDTPKSVSAAEWRMLAWYSWETDEQSVAGKAGPADLVGRLATRCPTEAATGNACDRLLMKGLLLAVQPVPGKKAAPRDATAAEVAAFERLLSNPARSRESLDIVLEAPPAITRLMRARGSDPAARWDALLAGIARDGSIPYLERLAALDGRVGLIRIDDEQAALPAELIADVRSLVRETDQAITDSNERQAVISAAADLLATADLPAEAMQLLTAELPRSHSPYYHMLGLASIARQSGDKATALDWYAKAHEAARGDATRLQWGASHVRALIDLAPNDGERIVATTLALLGEISPKASSFEGRNQAVLAKLSAKLSAWGKEPAHSRDWLKIRESWQALCSRLPENSAHRRTCLTPEQG